MFDNNKTSYFALSRLCLSNLQQLNYQSNKHFSVQISSNINVVILFGIIEKLIYTVNVQKIKYMVKQCEGFIQYLQTKQQNISCCQKFRNVMNELLNKLESSEEKAMLALKQLYYKKQSILAYLCWISQNKDINIIQAQYQIQVFQYSIFQNKLQIPQSDSSSIFHIRTLKLSNNKYCLFYICPFGDLDTVCKVYYRQHHFSKLITYYHNQLNKAKIQRQNTSQKIEQISQQYKKTSFQNTKLQVQINSKDEQISKIHLEMEQIKKQKIAIMDQLNKKQSYKRYRVIDEQQQQRLNRNTEIKRLPNNIQNYCIDDKKTIIKMNIQEIKIFNNQTPEKPMQQIRTHQINKRKTNFLNVDFVEQKIQKLCPICCEQCIIDYSIFICTHSFCLNCVVKCIKTALDQGTLPKCCQSECLSSQCNYNVALTCLLQNNYLELKDKLDDAILRQEYNEKIFNCPKCKNYFQINQNDKFIEHCNSIFCRKCGEQHGNDKKCDDNRYIQFLDLYEFPNVCPRCFKLYDKDNNCDHVVCKSCKQEDPQGYCASCSAFRYQTKSHDSSFHRKDCRFYTKNPQNLKRQKKCIQCNKLPPGQHCQPPQLTLREFLTQHFSLQFVQKFFQKKLLQQ